MAMNPLPCRSLMAECSLQHLHDKLINHGCQNIHAYLGRLSSFGWIEAERTASASVSTSHTAHRTESTDHSFHRSHTLQLVPALNRMRYAAA